MTPTEQSNLYRRLEINPNASSSEIRKAYLQMAKKWHPDSSLLGNSHTQFLAISEAFEVLSDSERRREYDKSIKVFERKDENHDFGFEDYATQTNLNRDFRRERKRRNSYRSFEELLRKHFYSYSPCK